MITQIKEWGNSQGLRINKHMLSEAGLFVGDNVDIEFKDGVITITPAKSRRKKYNLDKLIATIPKDYNVAEVDWGEPVGKEAW